MRMSDRAAGCASTLMAGLLLAAPAYAACPVELATYGEIQSGARVEFRPTGESATVTNRFRMLVRTDIVLDGIVMWTADTPRPYAMLMDKCPDGDVTGEELAACTVWEGIVYASDRAGNVGPLPAEGKPAPELLLFAGLGPSLAASRVWRGVEASAPWDVFALDGCQE